MATITHTDTQVDVITSRGTFLINPADDHTRQMLDDFTNDPDKLEEFGRLCAEHGLSNGIRVFLGKEMWLPEKEE